MAKKSAAGKSTSSRSASATQPARKGAGKTAGKMAAKQPAGESAPGAAAAREGAGKRAKMASSRKSTSAAAPRGKSNSSTTAAKPKRAAEPRTKKPALGRPKISGDEQLYLLFKEDFHARQIFDFLRVHTVKELEQYAPQQIVQLLSRPLTETVERIRRKLAEKNRYLHDDAEFAVAYHQRAER